MKKSILEKYAYLIASMGGAVKKNQDVIILAGLDQPEFVTMLTKACYKLGAAHVIVDFTYQPLSKIKYKYQKEKYLGDVLPFEEARLKYRVENNPVMIYLESDDPDGLKGIDQSKVAKAASQRFKVIKPYREQMENKYQWCIAAVPGKAWAKKVFPELPIGKAMEKLWEAILFTSRALDGDPNQNWVEHNKDLKARCEYINSLNLETLEYKSANGTDLKIGLNTEAVFMGGSEFALGSNIEYNPNIPSEEVFTSPMKGKAEGIVYASMPLSYNGELVENFHMVFKDGKVVECHAEKGENVLKEIIEADESSAYLGEVALVPYASPIRESGILFYNTLFDENAACHLALGFGFSNCLKNYQNYTQEECYKRGINDSRVHVDFMIGTKDLSIVGIDKDGKRIQIFKDGNWAF